MWCRQHQLKLSNALSKGTGIPAKTQAHLEVCIECRRFKAAVQRLEADLRKASPTELGEPSPGFHGRIMAAVQATQVDAVSPASEPKIRAFRPGWLWVGASAAGILLIVALAIFGPRKAHPPVTGVQAAETLALPLSVSLPVPMISELGQSVALQYESELDALQKDVEAGLNFLAACIGG